MHMKIGGLGIALPLYKLIQSFTKQNSCVNIPHWNWKGIFLILFGRYFEDAKNRGKWSVIFRDDLDLGYRMGYISHRFFEIKENNS